MTQKKIEPPYSWDLQENLLLKTGNVYTADYSYGFELIELAEGFYRINPRYVWKKSSGERDKMLKYILEVECKNC